MKDKLWFFGSYLPSLEKFDAVDAVQQRHAGRAREQTDNTHYFSANATSQLTNSHARQDRLQLGQAQHHRRAAGPRAAGRERHDGGDGAARHQRHPAELVAVGQLRLRRQRQVLHRRARRLLQAGPVQRRHPERDASSSSSTSNVGLAGVPAEFQHNTNFTQHPDQPQRHAQHLRRAATSRWTAPTTRNFAGSHTIKGGVQFDRIGNDVLDSEQRT